MKRWIGQRWVLAGMTGVGVSVAAGVSQIPSARGEETIVLKLDGEVDRKVTVVKTTRHHDGKIATLVRDPRTGETFTLIEDAPPAPVRRPTPPPQRVEAPAQPILPVENRTGDVRKPIIGANRPMMPAATEPAAPTPATTQDEAAKKTSLMKRIFGPRNPTYAEVPTPAPAKPAPVAKPLPPLPVRVAAPADYPSSIPARTPNVAVTMPATMPPAWPAPQSAPPLAAPVPSRPTAAVPTIQPLPVQQAQPMPVYVPVPQIAPFAPVPSVQMPSNVPAVAPLRPVMSPIPMPATMSTPTPFEPVKPPAPTVPASPSPYSYALPPAVVIPVAGTKLPAQVYALPAVSHVVAEMPVSSLPELPPVVSGPNAPMPPVAVDQKAIIPSMPIPGTVAPLPVKPIVAPVPVATAPSVKPMPVFAPSPPVNQPQIPAGPITWASPTQPAPKPAPVFLPPAATTVSPKPVSAGPLIWATPAPVSPPAPVPIPTKPAPVAPVAPPASALTPTPPAPVAPAPAANEVSVRPDLIKPLPVQLATPPQGTAVKSIENVEPVAGVVAPVMPATKPMPVAPAATTESMTKSIPLTQDGLPEPKPAMPIATQPAPIPIPPVAVLPPVKPIEPVAVAPTLRLIPPVAVIPPVKPIEIVRPIPVAVIPPVKPDESTPAINTTPPKPTATVSEAPVKPPALLPSAVPIATEAEVRIPQREDDKILLREIQPYVVTIQDAIPPSDRMTAARGLADGRHGSTSTVKIILFQTAQTDPCPAVRACCIDQLSRLGYQDAAFLEHIKVSSTDANEDVATSARNALHQLTPRR